jgi:hypothetical protein
MPEPCGSKLIYTYESTTVPEVEYVCSRPHGHEGSHHDGAVALWWTGAPLAVLASPLFWNRPVEGAER